MKVVLFGNGPFASMALYSLTYDSPFTVSGFTVDEAYIQQRAHHGLPVVPFELVQRHFPPDDHYMLLPIGPIRNNMLRSEKCAAAKANGFRLATYLSSRAIVPPDLELRENSMIFSRARIYARV